MTISRHVSSSTDGLLAERRADKRRWKSRRYGSECEKVAQMRVTGGQQHAWSVPAAWPPVDTWRPRLPSSEVGAYSDEA